MALHDSNVCIAPMSAFEPVIVQSDQERVTVWEFDEGRNHIRCLLSAADTAGRLAFFENRLSPGAVVPAHIHHNEDEYWYMIDDGLDVQIDSERIAIKANTIIAIPAGTEHAVFNTSDTNVRAIFFTTPGGLEEFFEGLNKLLASPESKPEDFAQLNQATGITFTSQD
jgi:mannose-6-phosphate isomerase-like protein (cupin superfamily)